MHEKLGEKSLALANRDYARQLGQRGATGTNNVQWVSPNQFAQGNTQLPRYTTAQLPTTEQVSNPALRIPGSRIPGSHQVAPPIHR